MTLGYSYQVLHNMWSYHFGLIVFIQAIVYKCENFLKVGVHMIINYQCIQTAR